MSKNPLVDDSSYRRRYSDHAALYDVGKPRGPDSKGWASGVPFWEDVIDTRAAIVKKDAFLASLGVRALTMDAVGAVDPVGFVASSITGWILEHFRPYREVLDLTCGYPDLIKDLGTSWGKVATHLGETHRQFAAGIEPGTLEWRGDAAEAFRTTAHGVAKLLDNASKAADLMGRLTLAAGEVVAGVRLFVRDLYADLVGTVVSYGVTRGQNIPVLLRQAAGMARRLTSVLEDMDLILTAIDTAFSAVKGVLETSVKAWRGYREGASGADRGRD